MIFEQRKPIREQGKKMKNRELLATRYLGLVSKTKGALPLLFGTRPSLINSIRHGLLLAKDPGYYVTRFDVSLLSMGEHPLRGPVRQQRVAHSEIQ